MSLQAHQAFDEHDKIIAEEAAAVAVQREREAAEAEAARINETAGELLRSLGNKKRGAYRRGGDER